MLHAARHLLSPGNFIPVVIMLLVLSGLYLISLYNYLIFHSIIEIATIVIAFAIFVITTRRNVAIIGTRMTMTRFCPQPFIRGAEVWGEKNTPPLSLP
jgi:hypothetical protein